MHSILPPAPTAASRQRPRPPPASTHRGVVASEEAIHQRGHALVEEEGWLLAALAKHVVIGEHVRPLAHLQQRSGSGGALPPSDTWLR